MHKIFMLRSNGFDSNSAIDFLDSIVLEKYGYKIKGQKVQRRHYIRDAGD
jgi:hypothetical protein